MISKDMLKCSLSVGLKNTEITKSFTIGQALVARWIKSNQFYSVLRELEDENELTELSHEMPKKYPNVGCHCTAGLLRAKFVKAKNARLKLILKILKIRSPLKWMMLDAEHSRA